MIIAFTGTSGSGKTTLINLIKADNLFSHRKVIVRNEDNFVSINLLKNILGKGVFESYKQEKFFKAGNSNFKSRIFSGLVSFFYPLLVYLEFLCEYLMYELVFKSKVIVRDRYIYDYIVTFQDVLNIYNPLAKFLFSNFPKPYLSIYIKISHISALNRNKNNIKGKITYEQSLHAKVLATYERTAQKKNLLILENDKDLRDSERKIKGWIQLKLSLSKIRSIAIVGIDGSGKSTLAANLYTLAREVGIRCDVYSFFYQNLLYKCLQRLKKLPNNRRNEKIKNNGAISTHFSSLWAWFVILDSFAQYYYTRIFKNNQLIIFDRFFYDYLASFEYLGIKYTGFLKYLIPKPDKCFVLLVNPQVAHKRKPENVVDYYIKAHSVYSQIASDYNINVIKSNKNIQRMADELISNLLKRNGKIS